MKISAAAATAIFLCACGQEPQPQPEGEIPAPSIEIRGEWELDSHTLEVSANDPRIKAALEASLDMTAVNMRSRLPYEFGADGSVVKQRMPDAGNSCDGSGENPTWEDTYRYLYVGPGAYARTDAQTGHAAHPSDTEIMIKYMYPAYLSSGYVCAGDSIFITDRFKGGYTVTVAYAVRCEGDRMTWQKEYGPADLRPMSDFLAHYAPGGDCTVRSVGETIVLKRR